MATAAARDFSREELVAWGEALGASLRAPAVITIEGDLGAGKTTLVQAVARGLGVREAVTSPTFALVHEYSSAVGPVYHLDFYRLEGPRDLDELGFDEMLDRAGIVMIEWPERAASRLPAQRRRVRLAHVADPSRRRLEELT